MKQNMAPLALVAILCAGVITMANNPLFAEIAFGANVSIVGVEKKPLAQVYDLSWPAQREQWRTTNALAVVPDNSPAGPGILYFHQLGMQRDRKQFLAEALVLAKSGVRSVLINGNAPWSEGWKGTAEDALMIDAQMADLGDIAMFNLRQLLQLADFISHHRESTPGLPGMGRLDCGIHGQQVGLGGYAGNNGVGGDQAFGLRGNCHDLIDHRFNFGVAGIRGSLQILEILAQLLDPMGDG
jgi:hypothetical protein